MKVETRLRDGVMDYFGYVSPSELLREADRSNILQSDAEGVGFLRMKDTLGATWMLVQVLMEFRKPARAGQSVTMETTNHEDFGVAILRRTSLQSHGKELLRVSTKILPVYLKERKVVPPEKLTSLWTLPAGAQGEDLERIVLPENLTLFEEVPVRYRDCDMNGHMTAYRYLDLVCEAIGYWGEHLHLLRRMQIDYRKECLPGDSLRILHGTENGRHYVGGFKPDGTCSFAAWAEFAEEEYPSIRTPNPENN